MGSPSIIYWDVCPCDVGRLIRCQEHRYPANFPGLGNTPHRCLGLNELVELFLIEILVGHRRFDESRTEAIDPYPRIRL